MFFFFYPRSTEDFLKTRLNVSVLSRSNWTIGELVWSRRPRTTGVPGEKNLSEQWWQSTANSAHIGGSWVILSPLTAPPLLPNDDDKRLIKKMFLYSYILFLELTISLFYGLLRISDYFTLIPLLPGEIVRARKTTRFNVSRSPKRAYIRMSFSVNCILNRTLNTPG